MTNSRSDSEAYPDVVQPSAEQRDTNRKQRVLLIDRMRLSRDCLARQIQDLCPDFELSVFSSPDSALGHADGRVQDVAILNVHGDLSNLEVTKELDKIRVLSAPIITILQHVNPGQVEEAAKRGLFGVFPADGSVELLTAAIRLVLAGGHFLPSARQDISTVQGFAKREPEIRAAGGQNRAFSARATSSGIAVARQCEVRFSDRESEILPLLRQGLQNKNIAHELGISESTVKAHLAHIMRKLGAVNRTSIVSLLVEQDRQTARTERR
jgi:DNA-binding NarL/FixJ family response regulator